LLYRQIHICYEVKHEIYKERSSELINDSNCIDYYPNNLILMNENLEQHNQIDNIDSSDDNITEIVNSK
jgi:hypothetical protein